MPFGVQGLRQASAMPVTPEPVVRVAESPDGTRVIVRAEPAPRAAWYRSDGLRWWRSLVGESRWWVTVLPINGALALMKKSHPDDRAALARAEIIASSVEGGVGSLRPDVLYADDGRPEQPHRSADTCWPIRPARVFRRTIRSAPSRFSVFAT